ncbi:MAG: extracellular solute-binding protein [Clostridiales bacterium]|nr:extracellular solute-binding protein [Clostridiales bacterium]
MRKTVSVLLAILMMINMSLLTSCHGSRGAEEFQIPESFDTSEKYEIVFWAKNDTNKTQTDIYRRAISEFESYYPNIKVNLKLYTDYGKIYNDVITNIATNTTPNVCITYPDHIATYMTGNNIVVPLDDLIADERYGMSGSEVAFETTALDEIVPQFMNECVIGGTHYALPFMRSTEALYINKDMVEALGYEIPDVPTWDFIWEVSRKATEKAADGSYLINGQMTMIPFIYKSTDNMMIQYLKQAGADYSTSEGDILLFNDTTSELLDQVAESVGQGAFSTFKISSYPGNFLNAGQCIFAVDSTAGATWMGSDAPLSDISDAQKADFETVVRPIPQVDPADPKMISQGPSVCIFNKKDPEEVLASWLFTQYLLTNSVQTAYAETEGYIPVTQKAHEDPAYQDYLNSTANDTLHYKVKLDATKLLLNNIDNTFVTPVFNGSTSLRDASGYLIESVAKSVRRKETIDLNSLYESTIDLYRLDQIGSASIEEDLGPLPTQSVILLCCIGVSWLLIGVYFIGSLLKERKSNSYSMEERKQK